MSWTDYYRRRDALAAVLEHARRNPAGDLPYDDVSDVFASPEKLVLALHYKWLLALTGRVGVAQAEAERDHDIDPVDAVSAAWRSTAAEHPTLRRLLDRHADTPALRAAVEGEQRMLALAAGLAEPADTTAQITRVGAAYLTLLRTTPELPARRRGPVEQLLRRLVPSA
ncbi:MAG TPA: hypothetical protein VGX25_15275 [Actinophytocola sp.]|uniref:hypothetical protein n=1 Tax=Actinophytocola sp. TaxID=1872138 RepID=UPI002DDCC260|nr:hypothetical protein [Actinophytocola sp.]HEV2780750.1 hypothetical protein [Actinophytocola sp.]